MLEQKIRESLIVPKNEPESLVMIRISEGIGWYKIMVGNHNLRDDMKVRIIADYLAREYGYEYTQTH